MPNKYKDIIKDYIVIIPARSGSKSIKNKNIKIINGKPLLFYSIESAIKAKFDNIIISSDSQKYLKISQKHKNIILHRRSNKNSRDTSTDLDVFKEVISFINSNLNIKFKYIVHLRPTTPYRNLKILRNAIMSFDKDKSKYSSLRSVNLMSNPSYKTMRIVNNKLCHLYKRDFNLDSLNQPRQNFQSTYLPNGYIDIIKYKNIKNNFLHGDKIMPYIIKDINSDIDDFNDYISVKKTLEELNI